jgi:hypothetical protein
VGNIFQDFWDVAAGSAEWKELAIGRAGDSADWPVGVMAYIAADFRSIRHWQSAGATLRFADRQRRDVQRAPALNPILRYKVTKVVEGDTLCRHFALANSLNWQT